MKGLHDRYPDSKIVTSRRAVCSIGTDYSLKWESRYRNSLKYVSNFVHDIDKTQDNTDSLFLTRYWDPFEGEYRCDSILDCFVKRVFYHRL
jgi:hypothetical protein